MYTHSARIARSVVLGIVFLTGTDGVRADPSTGHEVVERRTERSLTWLNADGTYTLCAYTRPIHFRAKNGTWQQIETDIKPTEKAGFTWSGERNSLRAYLPRKADGWTRVEAGDGALLFRPAGVSTGEFATKGNKAYLRQAWSGTTLSYYVAPGCLKEQMTLY